MLQKFAAELIPLCAFLTQLDPFKDVSKFTR